MLGIGSDTGAATQLPLQAWHCIAHFCREHRLHPALLVSSPQQGQRSAAQRTRDDALDAALVRRARVLKHALRRPAGRHEWRGPAVAFDSATIGALAAQPLLPLRRHSKATGGPPTCVPTPR